MALTLLAILKAGRKTPGARGGPVRRHHMPQLLRYGGCELPDRPNPFARGRIALVAELNLNQLWLVIGQGRTKGLCALFRCSALRESELFV